MKCFFFIAEFERAAKIRKIAVYCLLISRLVPKLQRFKEEEIQIKRGQKINQNQ